MTNRKHLRIVEEYYPNSKQFWVEKAVTVFGFVLWWSRTTISYFSSFHQAREHYEDLLYGEPDRTIHSGRIVAGYDLITHLRQQRAWSKQTFGPGPRAEGVLDHISNEMEEVRENPTDLEEWIDLVMLSLDGAWRSGAEPTEIADCLMMKLKKNQKREWPDWRTVDTDKAIEHK